MENIENSDKIGFIILRHVNNFESNKFWIDCYHSIRKIYPECYIIIVDDNSIFDFLSNIQLYKTTVIFSEFKGRGEFLPYYYYLKYKQFETAVIIHDTVFLNQPIDFTVDKYKIIWEFDNYWKSYDTEDEANMIKLFGDQELTDFYENKSLWSGCFGGMSIINHDYLTFLNDKYDIIRLVNFIKTRNSRMSFERVIACLLQKNYKKETLLGDIHNYCRWGLGYNERHNYNHLPLLKIWFGRG
jgi:hypothetical protein